MSIMTFLSRPRFDSSIFLTRFISAVLFTAVMSGTWDAWWHGALGRESFWSPPHLLLYAAVITAIGAAIYGWHISSEKLWRRLALALALIPLSAPFDELWHQLFGIEKISSPLIVWSPPHVLLIGVIIASFVSLLPLLRRDADISARQFFGALSLAAILALLLFLESPLNPVGPHHLAGFWGASVGAGMFTFILLAAQRELPGFAPAMTVTLFFLVISSMGLSERIAPGVMVPPHDHAPQWLVVFSLLLPAAIVDTFRSAPTWLRGGLTALLWSGVFFPFATLFFEPQFQYSFADTVIAVFSSLIAGLLVGLISGTFKNRTVSEHDSVSREKTQVL